jgi:hypothetical protein
VCVHGVDSEYSSLNAYIDRIGDLTEEFGLAGGDGAPASVDDISLLGVEWPSQKMMEMLASALNPAATMPSKIQAEEKLAPFLNELCRDRNVVVHFIAHSMGSQVLMYTLPKLKEWVKVGSMFFAQGFAPSSGFAAPNAKINREEFQKEAHSAAMNKLNEHIDKLKKYNYGFLGKDLPVSEFARSYISSSVNDLLPNVVKHTDFHQHVGKVSGPILATTTQSFWSDFQVGAAELSVYLAAGVLGVRGFYDGKDVPLHHVHQDAFDGGDRDYDFNGSKFFNLRAGDHISDHEDFKNRVVAFAHLRALGWLGRRNNRGAVPATGKATPDRWMTENWGKLKDRNLTQVCLPGAHDAGVGVIARTRAPEEGVVRDMVNYALENILFTATENKYLSDTLGLGAANLLTPTVLGMLKGQMVRLTQTQSLSIGKQLQHGCRYFDVRPAVGTDGDMYLAHGDYMSLDLNKSEKAAGKKGGETRKFPLGYVGALGERLDAVLADVAAFAADPDRAGELIVLKISHSADWRDPNNGSFGAEQADRLFGLLREKLGPVLIDRFPADARLDKTTLAELTEGGRRVLCLLESGLFGGGRSVGSGLYAYSELNNEFKADDPPRNFVLYDKYSVSRNSTFVIDDQRRKLLGWSRGAYDGAFLLSWTVTLTPSPALGDMRSILDMAKLHNAQLLPTLTNWIKRGEITAERRPNILYLDDYNADLLPAALLINDL